MYKVRTTRFFACFFGRKPAQNSQWALRYSKIVLHLHSFSGSWGSGPKT